MLYKNSAARSFYRWRNHVGMSSRCCFDDETTKARLGYLEVLDRF
jgi:hypothetical protein